MKLDKYILFYYNVVKGDVFMENNRATDNKLIEVEKLFTLIATCLNYIGMIIMLFDAMISWDHNVEAMTYSMAAVKIVSIIFIVSGTIVFLAVKENSKYEKIRKFLMINIPAYAIIVPMIIYLLDTPPGWRIIAYVFVVLMTEIFLLIKRK